ECEWKDPENISCAMPVQGVLTRTPSLVSDFPIRYASSPIKSIAPCEEEIENEPSANLPCRAGRLRSGNHVAAVCCACLRPARRICAESKTKRLDHGDRQHCGRLFMHANRRLLRRQQVNNSRGERLIWRFSS